MVHFIIASAVAFSTTVAGPIWSGDFILIIRGEGSAKKAPYAGTWRIKREARGRIVLDSPFKGAGIAGAQDSRNETRYATWIAGDRQPCTLKMDDKITVRGPLFSPKEIRFDTWQYQFPAPAKPEVVQGEVGSAILQLDSKLGRYTFESPRIYATVRSFFRREFVDGPPKWKATKPINNDNLEIAFEMVHGLNQPKDWYQMFGSFKPAQKEIVLTRKFPFTAPLATMSPASLVAELTLVLKLEE